MNFSFCGVVTQSKRYLVVPISWLENRHNRMTKVFYSPNKSDIPDFNLSVKIFVDETKSGVYNAFIMRFLADKNERQFLSRKRRRFNPIDYSTNKIHQWNFAEEKIDLTNSKENPSNASVTGHPKTHLTPVQTVPTNSQYRASSPQVSPRSRQISPHPQISPRLNVMSPAKPMQPQNVSNNPLSPHGHLPGSGPSQQTLQMQQQAAKNAASTQQAGSVSTLQAPEQMAMPPSVVLGPVMQNTYMDYTSAYRPSAQQMQHSAAAMNRGSMSNLNHQQKAQMNAMSSTITTNTSSKVNQSKMSAPVTATTAVQTDKRSIGQKSSQKVHSIFQTRTNSNQSSLLFDKAKTKWPVPIKEEPLSTSTKPKWPVPFKVEPLRKPTHLTPVQTGNKSTALTNISVSTLQALEQMVMPPSVAPGQVVQTSKMDYASSYRPSAQQMQHSAAANPLSPMTSISTSPQHHQQWPTMKRVAMSNLNHQQTAQMNLMSQQQMPNVSQMNETGMAPNRGQVTQLSAPQSLIMSSMSQNDTNLTQMDHMHMQLPIIPTSIDPMSSASSLPSMNNSTSSVISASSNLLDPFASAVDPIPPVIVTPVLSHMQSSVDTLQTTDSHASLMDKSMPMSNSMSDNSNTNSQMSMQQAAKNAAPTQQQAGSVSTLQALEQMVMPPKDQRLLSVEETIFKQEEDLRMAHQTIRTLQADLGTIIVDDSEIDDDVSTGEEGGVQVEVNQHDSFFAPEYTFKTNTNGDRYFLDGQIKISKDIVQTLKNMNTSTITNSIDYDYRFIKYLISQVFSKDTLAESAIYQSNRSAARKFRELDEDKLSFVRAVFKGRTTDKKRLQELSNYINKRCNTIRQNLKVKK